MRRTRERLRARGTRLANVIRLAETFPLTGRVFAGPPGRTEGTRARHRSDGDGPGLHFGIMISLTRPSAPATRRTPRLLLATTLVLATIACHSYRPAALASLNSGDQVRARLTPEQHEELRDLLLGGDRLVEGTVLETAADSVLMEVPVVTVAEGIRMRSYSQRIRVAVAGITEVELRAVDRGRTWGMAAAVGAVGGGLLWYEFGRRSRRDSATPPPPPEEGPPRLVFRIPLRLP